MGFFCNTSLWGWGLKALGLGPMLVVEFRFRASGLRFRAVASGLRDPFATKAKV